jgi:4-hydroxy-3-methylbut-2-enyl diphosphate reductase
MLVQRAGEIDWAMLANAESVGITAGASAPEVLVDEVLEALAERYAINASIVRTAEEPIVFNLPRELRQSI